LRGVALGRKNWLFAGSDAGGVRAARLSASSPAPSARHSSPTPTCARSSNVSRAIPPTDSMSSRWRPERQTPTNAEAAPLQQMGGRLAERLRSARQVDLCEERHRARDLRLRQPADRSVHPARSTRPSSASGAQQDPGGAAVAKRLKGQPLLASPAYEVSPSARRSLRRALARANARWGRNGADAS
jgi:hypothetical protein